MQDTCQVGVSSVSMGKVKQGLAGCQLCQHAGLQRQLHAVVPCWLRQGVLQAQLTEKCLGGTEGCS
jgi:hypothetical protein